MEKNNVINTTGYHCLCAVITERIYYYDVLNLINATIENDETVSKVTRDLVREKLQRAEDRWMQASNQKVDMDAWGYTEAF